jgi:hypothetical protein
MRNTVPGVLGWEKFDYTFNTCSVEFLYLKKLLSKYIDFHQTLALDFLSQSST